MKPKMNPKERITEIENGCERLWFGENSFCKKGRLCPECATKIELITETRAWVKRELFAWVKTELQDLKKWRTCIKNHNHLDEDQCIYAITEEDLDRFVREKLE